MKRMSHRFDGAMGSNLQSQNLMIIEKIHTGFLDVDCNVIETKSSGGEVYHGNLPNGVKNQH